MAFIKKTWARHTVWGIKVVVRKFYATKGLHRQPMPCTMADNVLSGGCFTNVLRALRNNHAKKTQCQKWHLRWEFQAETLYVYPKHGFGHTYKVPAWNSQKYDFCNTQLSREYLGELAKRLWNNPLASYVAKASVAKVLVRYTGNVPISALQGLTQWGLKRNDWHFADNIFKYIS